MFKNLHIRSFIHSYYILLYQYKPLGSCGTAIEITSQPVAQDEIEDYMAKYVSSSSASGMDDDDGNGDDDDPDAQQDYAAFNAWLDQLNRGEPAPSRPAVSRPPPQDAKPEADAPQVGGSVGSPASGSRDGGLSPDSVASPSEPVCCQLCKAPMTICIFGCWWFISKDFSHITFFSRKGLDQITWCPVVTWHMITLSRGNLFLYSHNTWSSKALAGKRCWNWRPRLRPRRLHSLSSLAWSVVWRLEDTIF